MVDKGEHAKEINLMAGLENLVLSEHPLEGSTPSWLSKSVVVAKSRR